MQCLIEQGADVNRVSNNKWTPLESAMAYGHVSIAKLLIERGADLNKAGSGGYPPLHNSVARWSRPISTDEHVDKAPFTVILAVMKVVEGCNKS
jgi:hypothetical protein